MFVRTGSLILVVSASLLTAACSAWSAEDTSALAPAKQGETSSELVLSQVENASSVAIASDDGACTALPTLVEANKDKLTSLCAQGQVPVPVAADNQGCEDGSVIKVKFACLAVNMPPIPRDQCIAFPVKDNGAMAQGLALDPQLVCARIGGAPPPFAAGGMQAQPGQPGQPDGADGFPQGAGAQPGQFQPGQIQPGQPEPGQPCNNGPMPPSGGSQGGHSPFPPGPPAIRCCAPTNGQ